MAGPPSRITAYRPASGLRGWDAAGAKSFGYTTFWVNRLKLPAERLGVVPDAAGQDLSDLVAFVKAAG